TDARVLGATLKAGESTEYLLPPGRYAYLVPATGKVDLNGVQLDARDGAAIRQESTLKVPALGRRAGTRCACRRQLLLLGAQHRRVLSAVLRGAPRPPRERGVPRHRRRGGARRLSPVQALPARPAIARRAAGGDGHRRLPTDRAGRDRTHARTVGATERTQPLPSTSTACSRRLPG